MFAALMFRYDFFLVSQSVRQGTVNPTSYNIIKDTSGLKPKHIQALTYKLTHLYYNWPGTVRVPAPCQYAHKLAFMVTFRSYCIVFIKCVDCFYFQSLSRLEKVCTGSPPPSCRRLSTTCEHQVGFAKWPGVLSCV